MFVGIARTSIHDGDSLVVQDTWSTWEMEGCMRAAKRWLHLLAPHCNGLLEIGMAISDPSLFRRNQSCSVVVLRVYRRNVAVSFSDLHGIWPADDGTQVTVILRNLQGDVVAQQQLQAGNNLQQRVEQAIIRLVQVEDDDPDWRSTTPVLCQCLVNEVQVLSARVELTCEYELDDPF